MAAIVILGMACNDNTEVATRKNGFSDTPKTKEDSLYHQVMEGHDAGMVKIGKLRAASARIQQAIDSLNRSGAGQSAVAPYQQLQRDLKYADSSMYRWMEEFKVDSAKENPAQRISYLENEKEKVTKVKDAILTGLQRADSLINKR